jgi:hypothetical protein
MIYILDIVLNGWRIVWVKVKRKLLQIKNVCNILIDLFYLERKVSKMCNCCETGINWDIIAINNTEESEIYDVCIISNKIVITDCYDEMFEVEIFYCPICGRKL